MRQELDPTFAMSAPRWCGAGKRKQHKKGVLLRRAFLAFEGEAVSGFFQKKKIHPERWKTLQILLTKERSCIILINCIIMGRSIPIAFL